jgi:hypothetical protein
MCVICECKHNGGQGRPPYWPRCLDKEREKNYFFVRASTAVLRTEGTRK